MPSPPDCGLLKEFGRITAKLSETEADAVFKSMWTGEIAYIDTDFLDLIFFFLFFPIFWREVDPANNREHGFSFSVMSQNWLTTHSTKLFKKLYILCVVLFLINCDKICIKVTILKCTILWH